MHAYSVCWQVHSLSVAVLFGDHDLINDVENSVVDLFVSNEQFCIVHPRPVALHSHSDTYTQESGYEHVYLASKGHSQSTFSIKSNQGCSSFDSLLVYYSVKHVIGQDRLKLRNIRQQRFNGSLTVV